MTRIPARIAPALRQSMAMLLLATGSPMVFGNCTVLPGNVAATPDARFIVNGNGTVTDIATQLMWTESPIGGGPFSQAQAQVAADASAVGGHSDWRLPTRAEFSGIIETGCSNPALNTSRFMISQTTTFWSSETAGEAAFSVDFTHGISQTEDASTPKAARLVRSVASTLFADGFE